MIQNTCSALRSSICMLLLLCACAVSNAALAKDKADAYEPSVVALMSLLEERADLAQGMDAALAKADMESIRSMDQFYAYLDDLVTWIPIERVVVPRLLALYYIVNQAPGDMLNEDVQFSAWLKSFVQAYGAFLDTPASAAGIPSFASMPNYNIDDYFVGPSGWLTFNQFFAREMRPGKRPVAAARDDKVIVSPADAVFMGTWPIDDNSNITVKGANWEIAELLAGSPYEDAFKGGIYTHSFLYIDDYHRYHLPVAGTVKEIRNISGRVYMDVSRNADGSFDVVDGDTYQFNQERGLVVVDSPELGLVAILPIGMSYVSSVNLTPEVGAQLRKGDPFGYFLFGGSDIVMLFQDANISLDAEVGKKYLQGQRLGAKK
ncbi:MAG: phosphatidylserine decarboxylase [Halieaceae bacterium]